MGAVEPMGPVMTSERFRGLRREIGAMLFMATPPEQASDSDKAAAYSRRVRPLLQLLDILDGKAPAEETEICEGCETRITHDQLRVHCDDGPVLCENCTPEESRSALTYAYRDDDAERDIARARQFAADWMGDGQESALTEERFFAIAREIYGEGQEWTLDMTIDQAGFDSLDLVELVMGIEQEFDVEVPDHKIDNWRIKKSTLRTILADVRGFVK